MSKYFEGLDSFISLFDSNFTDPLGRLSPAEVEFGGDAESRLPNPMEDYGPHPKQIAFHRDSAKRRLYIGGNRS